MCCSRGTMVVKSHPVDQTMVSFQPETPWPWITRLTDRGNRTDLNERKPEGVKLPVCFRIFVEPCSQAHGIGEGHTQEPGPQCLMLYMINPVQQRPDARHAEDNPQKTDHYGVNGLGRQQEENGSDKKTVHSIFACKYTEFSNGKV